MSYGSNSNTTNEGHSYWWSTQCEKDLIDTLGAWAIPNPTEVRGSKTRRFKCLMGYRRAFYLRTDWGEMDRLEILDYLNEKLSKWGVPPLRFLRNDDPSVIMYRIKYLYKNLKPIDGVEEP